VTERSLLEAITHPEDLRKLPLDQLPELACQIREELLDVVSNRGGHLASNLGVVELTVALLRALDLDNDSVVWDTGHQGYVFKMLTGRRDLLHSLRQDDGCCGFLHRDESVHDVFGAGHAGTAISAGLGLAAARDRSGKAGKVVAVVGDGALGTGVSLEGLNSIIETTQDFVLILNDNRMSIAPNVGALSRYLNRIIAGERYNRIKQFVRDLVCRIPRFGDKIRRLVQRAEEATKSMIVPGVLFEELGLRYIGPLDGHDLSRLVPTLETLLRLRQPLVIHVLTEKGRGYPQAESEPEVYHGLSPFDVEQGVSKSGPVDARAVTFSACLGDVLSTAIARDSRVMAITAGMCQGTGLNPVREKHPKHYFDVGIAEEHAVVFAAGLAAADCRPVVAIYASFMQRAMDYVFHDVCLQNLPVVFCLDRAGVVADGPTHHGILDIGFWQTLPNLSVLQPADEWELQLMLDAALERGAPTVIRYPKGNAEVLPGDSRPPVEWGKAETLRDGGDVVIWASGREAVRALDVADALAAQGIEAGVVNARFLMPMDGALLATHLERGTPLVTLENHCVEGGLATLVGTEVQKHGMPTKMLCKGWPRAVVPWGSEDGIRRKFRLDTDSLAADIADFVNA
jgi:1-deoxy-D-xylulose-5-phosphate synthase